MADGPSALGRVPLVSTQAFVKDKQQRKKEKKEWGVGGREAAAEAQQSPERPADASAAPGAASGRLLHAAMSAVSREPA